ncbi:MAG TPA: phenazine antibiotic biosynthesis protein [Mycobacterium sp.]|nr:phenazine antibiotic biosynthesis protein [Mycobacterium sp.]
MSQTIESILDPPFDTQPDPEEFIRAAMEWYFNPLTGSAFWLDRATSLGFDPRTDIKTHEDLTLFPNVTNELRDVRVEDLIPRGYGANPEVVRVAESGGTTDPPKRVVVLRDWWDRVLAWMSARADAQGFPRDANWLRISPSGPHLLIGELGTKCGHRQGGIKFSIDMDPRWIKKLIAAGRREQANAYVAHRVEQATFQLRTQDIGVLITTPAMLERIARRDNLVRADQREGAGHHVGGTSMDTDTRHLYRTEVFPGARLCGVYGSTMILGNAIERLDLTDDDPCVFDTLSRSSPSHLSIRRPAARSATASAARL